MRKADTYKNVNPVSKSIHLFLILFLLFGSLLGGVVAVFYKIQFNSILDDMKINEIQSIIIQKNGIESKMNDIVSDLIFLSRQNELKQYLNTNDPKFRSGMEMEYENLAFCKKRYDQIRYLNALGQEIVRINYKNGTSFAVKGKSLQNKSKRYYFRDTFGLKEGQIFVSPLDLNVENGRIEQPFKPVIRLGTPIFNQKKKKLGIVLVNYLGQNLLDDIERTSTTLLGSPMLLNKEGYWLFNKDREKEWGFMMPQRNHQNFAGIYPKEWKQMLQKKTGQIHTQNGMFTFTTIYPLQKNNKVPKEFETDFSDQPENETNNHAGHLIKADSNSYFWIQVAHVSPEILKKNIIPLQFRIFFLGTGLFVFTALMAWFLAFAITKRRIYQNHLIAMALYDPLTSLPNRKLFFERLEAGCSHAQRNEKQFGLLYIDLDGFKAVNDNFGHEAGDKLLIKTSERMLAVTRQTDTVARLGGDEFAIILFQVKGNQGMMSAAKKLIQEINKPIDLSFGNVSVGASIGAAVYPDNTQDLEELVKLADQAMYVSKSRGKNMCTLSEVKQ